MLPIYFLYFLISIKFALTGGTENFDVETLPVNTENNTGSSLKTEYGKGGQHIKKGETVDEYFIHKNDSDSDSGRGSVEIDLDSETPSREQEEPDIDFLSGKIKPHQESDEESDWEDYGRSELIQMQKVLLVLAGVTCLCILIYSIYYVNEVRKIYSKERISS